MFRIFRGAPGWPLAILVLTGLAVMTSGSEALPRQAPPAGKASGTITVDGKAMTLQTDGVERVLALMRKAGRNPKDEADLKEGLEFMAAMQPANPKVTGGFVSGDRAVVYVVETQEKEKEYGTIELVREEGAWRVSKQSWGNTPPKGQ